MAREPKWTFKCDLKESENNQLEYIIEHTGWSKVGFIRQALEWAMNEVVNKKYGNVSEVEPELVIEPEQVEPIEHVEEPIEMDVPIVNDEPDLVSVFEEAQAPQVEEKPEFEEKRGRTEPARSDAVMSEVTGMTGGNEGNAANAGPCCEHEGCGNAISPKVLKFSMDVYGKPLCVPHQKLYTRK